MGQSNLKEKDKMDIREKNISIVRGDSKIFQINFKDSSGNPYPLETGNTIYFTVKEQSDFENALIEKTATNFPDGVVLFNILPEDTKNLDWRTYVYDIRWKRPDGSVKTLIERSDFELKREVSNV